MGYTVGLDFGTHQTKVCVEINDGQSNFCYEFVTFKDLYGKTSPCIPSAVQINNDDTLSYGFCNYSKCKYIRQPVCEKPVFETAPDIEFPPKPLKPDDFDISTAFTDGKDYLPWQKTLLLLKQKNSYKESKEYKKWLELNTQYHIAHNHWKETCEKITIEYEKNIDTINERNNEKLRNYERQVEISKKPICLLFENFKQAVYDRSIKMPNNVDPQLISIWYLSYILFELKSRYGNEISIQMGVPCDKKSFVSRNRICKTLMLSAYHLVEDVFKNDRQSFLKTKYYDLIKLTNIKEFSEEESSDNSIYVFPEAIASLKLLVANNMITKGRLHIMVDIGGGTTDISFFSIGKHKENTQSNSTLVDELTIYDFHSIRMGLNFINDVCRKINSNGNKIIDKDKINLYYFKHIENVVNKIVEDARNSFKKSTNIDEECLTDALKDNIILYCGGGSTNPILRKRYDPFNDIKTIGKSMFPEREIININDILDSYPILSNSYGLAHSEIDDNMYSENEYTIKNISGTYIRLETINNLFKHLEGHGSIRNNYDHSKDYTVADT